MRKRERAGFTLIELLVVIAIIAVLAAILFPIFTAAREAGKRGACVANMKEQSGALAMYRDDYSGRMPYEWTGGGIWNVMTKAHGIDYLRQRVGTDARNILKCPSAPWVNQANVNANTTRTTQGYAYQLNETGWRPQSGLPSNPYCLAWGVPDSKVLRPSQLIYIAEAMGWTGYGVSYHDGNNLNNETATDGHPGQGGPGWQGYWPKNSEVIPFNGDAAGPKGGTICKIYNLRVSHRGSTNVLMYDGHVKTMTTSLGKNWGNYDNKP